MTNLIPADIAATLGVWQAQGLVPLEITERDLVQRITVTHNAATKRFEVTLDKLDGAQALGLLADVMASVWRDWFRNPLRPSLNSGQSKVCIQLDGDRLSMAFGTQDPANPQREPFADPVIAKGLMVAALFGLCEKADGDFNPLDALLGRLTI